MVEEGSYNQDDGLKTTKQRTTRQTKKQGLGFLENIFAHEPNIPKKSKDEKEKRAEDPSRECEAWTYNDSLAMDLIFFAFAHVEDWTLGEL